MSPLPPTDPPTITEQQRTRRTAALRDLDDLLDEATDHEAAVVAALTAGGVIVLDTFPDLGSGLTAAIVTSSSMHAAVVLVGYGDGRHSLATHATSVLAAVGYGVTSRSSLEHRKPAGTVSLAVDVAP